MRTEPGWTVPHLWLMEDRVKKKPTKKKGCK